MAQHNEFGNKGEQLAINFLLKKGYTILDQNWRFQKAEVDIIARKNETLAVVEVKTRSSIDFGNPQDFVNPKKIKLLVSAIDEYVISKDLEVNVRFDIIAVVKENNNFTFKRCVLPFLKSVLFNT